jgi:3-oxoacyl-[acyl-carrier-protein] synthase-3
MSSLEVVPEALDAEPQARVAGLVGLGCALPAESVTTGRIAARVGVEPEWILKRTGIAARRRLAPGATLTDLAERAGRAALADAGVDALTLDGVFVATALGDHIMPATAPLIATRLGATHAMAWDINLACTGFLAALEQGAALIESGRAEHLLIIAADGLSRLSDHDDRKTAALFGDGAGAVVLSAGGPMRLGHSVLWAEGDEDRALIADTADLRIHMDGHVVFQRAVAGMERCCRTVLDRAGLTVSDLDLVVPHQANARITVALSERLGIEPARVVDAIRNVGNTGAASIPLALEQARRDGRVPERGRMLLTAFGAGFAAGALLIDIP